MGKKSKAKQTNEQEFQSQVASWLQALVKKRNLKSIDKVTSETPDKTSKRNDLVIWRNRAARDAMLAVELKTPTTPINDAVFFNDALEKGQKWKAAHFGVWNMQRLEVYSTPAKGMAPPLQPLFSINTAAAITTVEDWLDPVKEAALRDVAEQMLDAVLAASAGISPGFTVDSEVFVSRLASAITDLRVSIYTEMRKAAGASKKLRKTINQIATKQGFAGFVDDIDHAISGQLGYRIVGQVLFYFALRRKNTSLPPLAVDIGQPLLPQLSHFWNLVRKFDYEALFGPDQIDELIEMPDKATETVASLVESLGHYDWASLSDDLLGTVFESLIPRREQVLLGQFYTPKPVADLLVALVADGEKPLILDPGCGSGTFLLSAYEYHAFVQQRDHGDILPLVWGFDLSTFATELAAINLYRQDLSSFDNYPRIVPGNFFDRSVGQIVEFPPARVGAAGGGKQKVPIPHFNAIVANPPYLRSQQQDDLDPSYKSSLFASSTKLGITAPAKTDLFAFFLFHASSFLAPGGRVGFVTPSSWLSSDYGQTVQAFLTNGLRLRMIVTSEAESFFTQAEVNTVLLVAQKLTDATDSEPVRFVTLKKPLAEVFKDTGSQAYWRSVRDLAVSIESESDDSDKATYRVKLAAIDAPKSGAEALNADSNWAKYLRAPLSYYKIFAKT